MLIQYFKPPSRIEELRNCPGGHLLEDFAKELAAVRYQWVAARQHIRTAEHFLRWIGHRGLSVTTVEERRAKQFLDRSCPRPEIEMEEMSCHGLTLLLAISSKLVYG